jgi:hypothetical protein
MRNILAVLIIAAGAIAALTLVGEDDATASTGAEAQVADVTPPATPRWEYRVLSARVNPIALRANADAGVQLIGLRSSATTSGSSGADPLGRLERELNRLGGEGWEMCSAAADGTMVFRRGK